MELVEIGLWIYKNKSINVLFIILNFLILFRAQQPGWRSGGGDRGHHGGGRGEHGHRGARGGDHGQHGNRGGTQNRGGVQPHRGDGGRWNNRGGGRGGGGDRRV